MYGSGGSEYYEVEILGADSTENKPVDRKDDQSLTF